MTRRASLPQVLHAINNAGLRAVKVSVSASGDIEVLTDATSTALDPALTGVIKRASRLQETGGR
jgi:hypothetical protein